MKALLKDLCSLFLNYFLVYFALYVLIVVLFSGISLPIYIKDTIFDIFLPIYGICFALLWMKRKKISTECMRFKKVYTKETMLDIAAVFGINIGLTWLASMILGLFMKVEGNIDMNELLSSPLLSLFVYGLLVPIDEEFFFRGLLMNSLEHHGRWKAALVISIVFGIGHFNPLVSLSAFVISMCMFALRFKTTSLWPCILVHMCVNILNQLSVILSTDSLNAADIALFAAVIYGCVYLFQKRKTIKTEFLQIFQEKTSETEKCSESI